VGIKQEYIQETFVLQINIQHKLRLQGYIYSAIVFTMTLFRFLFYFLFYFYFIFLSFNEYTTNFENGQ